MIARAAAPLLLAALTAAPAPAHGQAMDTFGMGSRSTAMGGAVSADVADFSANFYNPAGLARSDEMRIALGYMGVHSQMYVNDIDSSIDAVRGIVAGFVVPGRFGDVGFAFGLGVHLGDNRVSRSRTLPRTTPRWELYDNRPHRTFLAAHLALRPVDWLLIGGGIGFQAISTTTLELRGTLDIPSPAGASQLEQNLIGDLKTLRYPQAGVQIVPNDDVSFGVAYRGEYRLSNVLAAEGLAGVTGVAAVPPELYVLIHTESVNSFSPQQLSFGASVRVLDWLKINAELTWVDWSDYETSIGSSDVVLTLDVPPELMDFIEVPDEIASTRALTSDELGMRDRWVPRIGIEARAAETDALALDVRAGYFFESSPIPEQQGPYNLIDTDRHAMSLGAGIVLTDLEPTVRGFLAIDLHLQYSILPERTMQKQSLVDTFGDYRARGSIFAAGLTTELGFD